MSNPFAPFVDRGDDGFSPIAVVEEHVCAIPREEARAGYRVFRGRDGFEVAIPEHVVERVLACGRHAAPQEWFGLVVGRVHEDDRGRHVVVLGIVPDPEARAEHGFVETSTTSEFRTRTSARLLYPDGIVIGWIHGHVEHGARYSATDRRTQATWTQPHSLGIVVDPWDANEIAVYRGPECEELSLVPCGSRRDVRPTTGTPPAKSVARRRPFVVGTIVGPSRTIAAIMAVVALGIIAFDQRGSIRVARAALRAERAELRLLRRLVRAVNHAPLVPAAPATTPVACRMEEAIGTTSTLRLPDRTNAIRIAATRPVMPHRAAVIVAAPSTPPPTAVPTPLPGSAASVPDPSALVATTAPAPPIVAPKPDAHP